MNLIFELNNQQTNQQTHNYALNSQAWKLTSLGTINYP
jgi:hypothetical protein